MQRAFLVPWIRDLSGPPADTGRFQSGPLSDLCAYQARLAVRSFIRPELCLCKFAILSDQVHLQPFVELAAYVAIVSVKAVVCSS